MAFCWSILRCPLDRIRVSVHVLGSSPWFDHRSLPADLLRTGVPAERPTPFCLSVYPLDMAPFLLVGRFMSVHIYLCLYDPSVDFQYGVQTSPYSVP